MRKLLVALTVVLADVLCGGSLAQAANTIRIWKVGSPHRGDIPVANTPVRLQEAANRIGVSLTVESFPARGFAAVFRDAAARNVAPDVLSFNNFGVMTGITTALGTFEALASKKSVSIEFIRVTGAFDDLLGPERGWTYLVRSSLSFMEARALAMRAPDCPRREERALPQELIAIVPRLAAAYLQGNMFGPQDSFDPNRLATARSRPEDTTAGAVGSCGWSGNDKIAFVQLGASYVADSAIGQTLVLLVLRKPASTWQLLVAARDPVTNTPFWNQVRGLRMSLAAAPPSSPPPLPATLLSPEDGDFPGAPAGQRFGNFEWHSSRSPDVVAEIVEFAYEDDARLFVTRPGGHRQISAGQLWTTKSTWHWRVWSINSAGDIAFSSARAFPH